MRTSDALQGKVAEMFKPFGLSPTQYNALRILRGAGPDGLACSEVGKRMIHRDPDITRLLNRLECRHFIQRGRDPEDRRVIKARITQSGLALGHLGERKLKSLIALLQCACG